MIKENQKMLNIFNIFSDGALVFCSLLAAYVLRFIILNGIDSQGFNTYLVLGLAVIPFFLFLYALFGLYESFRAKRFTKELELLLQANFIGTATLVAVQYILKNIDFSRWLLVFFFIISTGSIAFKRWALRRILRHYRSLGYNQKHVLIVGSGKAALQYYSAIRKDLTLGLTPAGYISAENKSIGKLRRLGGFDKLEEILTQHDFDEVVAALSIEEIGYISQVIQDCEKHGVKLSLIPFYADYMSAHPYIDEVGGLPLMNIRRIPLDNMANAFVKRAMDICGALVLIVLSSPVMLVAAIGTKLSSPGPVIFKQERVGLNKKPFVMYKFRSMRVNDKETSGWSTDRDPRKTKFGALIRKCSIDELPQFFNVLKGDMSLVGPRPELPHFVDQFKESIPLYMVKHQVRPGITGWAQVNGFRGDTSIEERIRHDLFYIENWSPLLDVKILLMTVFKAFNSEKLS